jgi:DinB superfamily
MHKIGVVRHEGSVYLWVLDLPGCIVVGREVGDAEGTLPLAIAEHVGWLRAQGEAVESDGTWEIVETKDPVEWDALFEWEQTPMPDEELESLIRRIGYARAELLASIDGVADAVLDWEPPRSAFATFDAWAPEVRTIRGVAHHVFQFEPFYRDGLRDGPAAGIYERVSEPATEHELTVERLRSLSAEDRSRVWRPLRPGGSAPEEWTVRKVVRRMVSHDRAHAAEIWQRRSWVLLGAPGPGD